LPARKSLTRCRSAARPPAELPGGGLARTESPGCAKIEFGAQWARRGWPLPSDGERQITAIDFLVDYLANALEPDEFLTGIRVPKLGPGRATVTRNSTGRRSPGRLLPWRLWPGAPMARWPGLGSACRTWAPYPSGQRQPRAPQPERRPAATRCGRPRSARTRARNRRLTCTGRPITVATWRGC